MRQQKRVLNPPYQLLAWLSSGRHINRTMQCTIQMATPPEIGPCPLFSPQPFSLKLIADFENINMTQAMPTSKSGYHLPFTIGKSKIFSNLIIMTAAFSYVDIRLWRCWARVCELSVRVRQCYWIRCVKTVAIHSVRDTLNATHETWGTAFSIYSGTVSSWATATGCDNVLLLEWREHDGIFQMWQRQEWAVRVGSKEPRGGLVRGRCQAHGFIIYMKVLCAWAGGKTLALRMGGEKQKVCSASTDFRTHHWMGYTRCGMPKR